MPSEPDKERGNAARRRHAGIVLATDSAPLDTSGLRYDYALVPAQHRELVKEAAVDILANKKRAAQTLVQMGKRLLEIRALLADGTFTAWTQQELDFGERTAQYLMNVAREYGERPEIISVLSDTVLYLLAAPSTPAAARAEVEALALSEGRSPRVATVKEVLARHKPAAPAQTPPTYTEAAKTEPPARAKESLLGPPYDGQGWVLDAIPAGAEVGGVVHRYGSYKATNTRTGEIISAASLHEIYRALRAQTKTITPPAGKAVYVEPKERLHAERTVEVEYAVEQAPVPPPEKEIIGDVVTPPPTDESSRWVLGDIPLPTDPVGDFDYMDQTLFALVRVDIRSGMFQQALMAATAAQIQIALDVLPARVERRRSALALRQAELERSEEEAHLLTADVMGVVPGAPDLWCSRVLHLIQEHTLAEAGLELAQLVDYALKTRHSEHFTREVRTCVHLFWNRCAQEKEVEKP